MQDFKEGDNDIPQPTAADALSSIVRGAVPLEDSLSKHNRNHHVPRQLMDIGHHRDDNPDSDIQRQHKRRAVREIHPRAKILQTIKTSGRRRLAQNFERNANT